MIINVTQEDIESGKEGDPFQCPIALAITRVTGDNSPEAYPFEVVFWGASYKVPLSVWNFMQGFDGGAPVKPFSFEV